MKNTDWAGNIAITGAALDAINFGGGWLYGNGVYNIFVAKFAPSGAYLWAHRAGGMTDNRGLAVAAEPSGNVLAAGSFAESVNFGGGLLTSPGGSDAFLVKFAPQLPSAMPIPVSHEGAVGTPRIPSDASQPHTVSFRPVRHLIGRRDILLAGRVASRKQQVMRCSDIRRPSRLAGTRLVYCFTRQDPLREKGQTRREAGTQSHGSGIA